MTTPQQTVTTHNDNNTITIRAAKAQEINRIMDIYDCARSYMRSQGNTVQWTNGYPQQSLLEADIDQQQLFVIEHQGSIEAVFAFILGDDATYQHIEGQWLDNKSYGTLHRLASTGAIPNTLHQCINYCFTLIDNIRVDTHEQNATMRHLLANEGFEFCGIIYVSNGTPRLAFQKRR